MVYTLDAAVAKLHNIRNHLAELEERAANQHHRVQQLQREARSAHAAHVEAVAVKSATLAEFGAGYALQADVDRARRLVDVAARRVSEAEELVRAVESDLSKLAPQIQKLNTDIGTATHRAWQAMFHHLATNRPPEVDAYLERLWAA